MFSLGKDADEGIWSSPWSRMYVDKRISSFL